MFPRIRLPFLIWKRTFLLNSLQTKNPPALLRCTIFNSQGELILHNKDIERVPFMKRHNLAVRDFRKISRPTIVPAVVTRPSCILVNILNLRALIKHDVVVVFDAPQSGMMGPNNQLFSQLEFYRELQTRLKDSSDKETPYEFRALEAVLMNVMQNLTTEYKVHETVLNNLIKQLEQLIDRVKLRYFLIELKKITQFHRKVALIHNMLEELLDSDDELNDMYLTDRARDKVHTGSDHTEIEMLLEHYLIRLDEIVQQTEGLRRLVKTLEEIINVILDSNRNELMMLGLKYSTGLLSMGAALWVAALYGMNLENYIEESDGGFEAVVVFALVVLTTLLVYSVIRLRRVGKLRLGHKHRLL